MDIREAADRFRRAGKIHEWGEAVIDLYGEEKDYDYVKSLRRYLRQNIGDSPDAYMNLLRQSYILTARDKFDDYMIAMEWDRENKFYLPRRASLHNMVGILQDLMDDKADIACISMPPGTGKSGVALFYITLLGGRDPLNGILSSSHKNQFLQGAYQETLREISSPEYNWNAIFPERKVAVTDAKNLSIGVDKAQRFNTFQFASISAGLAGLARAKQLLYCDYGSALSGTLFLCLLVPEETFRGKAFPAQGRALCGGLHTERIDRCGFPASDMVCHAEFLTGKSAFRLEAVPEFSGCL